VVTTDSPASKQEPSNDAVKELLRPPKPTHRKLRSSHQYIQDVGKFKEIISSIKQTIPVRGKVLNHRSMHERPSSMQRKEEDITSAVKGFILPTVTDPVSNFKASLLSSEEKKSGGSPEKTPACEASEQPNIEPGYSDKFCEPKLITSEL
jgi:hypothetical protein